MRPLLRELLLWMESAVLALPDAIENAILYAFVVVVALPLYAYMVRRWGGPRSAAVAERASRG